MLKNFLSIKLLIAAIFLFVSVSVFAQGQQTTNGGGDSTDGCVGRITDPISDICWSCIFPIRIASATISANQVDNRDPPPPNYCYCPAPPPVYYRPGIGVSYWEPARIAEVVRKPMCSVTLGGEMLGDSDEAPAGTHDRSAGKKGDAFYHVHWWQYPVLTWIAEEINSSMCDTDESYDILYMSELDSLWADDQLSFVINPEAALFNVPHTQLACVADSVTALATLFGIDELYWCAGSQGSVYPLSGSHSSHVGGVDSSLAIVHTHLYKMHRQFMALDTSTYGAICEAQPQPIMRKTQYKQQMLYPIPHTRIGYGLGMPSMYWAAGREYPYEGEDFAYLVWRKRLCCAF